ncbi:antibiotic biosynthesis monooxygenase [Paenibacillus sp. HB172176]|uniref:putative quinol monooxygenase n=1 Tax=Paenibacillus sp. HB172176 TaxID=2493690 RepID=UPI00143B1CEB|nr:antibiotic biosynthesis monooxygenase [Paenibacillus sp. HB172176]
MNRFAAYGKLTAHPGQRDALAQALLSASEQLEAMDGCAMYIINESEDPDVLWLTELWRDAEAHASSRQNEKVLKVVGSCRPMIAGAESIRLKPVGGKGLL